MKTLVTGATGFIGSAVVRALQARGRQVRGLVEPGADRRNVEGLDVELVEGDITDAAAVGRAIAGCDVVYHLAAIYKLWLPHNERMYRVNCEGTTTVMLAALRAGVRKVVHTSSIAAVGLAADGELADESTPFNYWDDANDYMRSKWLSERDVLAFAAAGLPVVVVNPAFPFGEGDIAPTPTGSLIIETLGGRMPASGPGGFNVVDVDDVAAGHVLAEERGRVGERYILGSHNLTYKEFFAAIADVARIQPVDRVLPGPVFLGVAWAMEQAARLRKSEPRITLDAARYAARKVWFDTRRARDELGVPVTPLRETIAKAVTWFRANGYA